MTDNPSTPPSRPGPAGAATGAYDLSIDGVPEHWVEAQQLSPIGAGDLKPVKHNAHFSVIPRRRESPFVANVAALAGAFLGGAAWYFADVVELYRGPWAAIAVGALIALIVRFASGAQPAYRAVVAAAAYLLTLLIVLILITHRDLSAIYGSTGSLEAYEDTLIRTRFQNLGHLLAYGLGALAAVIITAAGEDG